MNTLDCLVYTSRAKLGGSDRHNELAAIIAVSAFRNAQAGITGILTLQDDYFIQLLEGTPSALDLLMLHLHFDPRHEDIKVVAREKISQREVTGWAMIGPEPTTPPHPLISQMLTEPAIVIQPWRGALVEMLGVPA